MDSLSRAEQMRFTARDGLPRKAALHHLFNDALSRNLPRSNVVVPELNTFAVDSNDSSKIVSGELDFYIGGDLPWALELLRQGSKLGRKADRMDEKRGINRTVPLADYLVIDCLGPKADKAMAPEPSKCTLYFSEDFRKCTVQMRLQEAFEIELAE